MGLIYRLEKGSRLTHEQLDENFRYLNSKVAEVSAKTEIASSQVSVIPLGGLSYAVRADSYPIGEIDYSATPMTITLAAASTTPNFDRLDLIYADVNGNIGKITGVAGTDTAPPDFDPTTQYVIRFILVKANALVGTDPITDIDIVDFYLYKNGGENGFVPTANNASITINNTVAPISETQDVKGYLTSISHKFTLTSPVELNFADFDNFIFDCDVTATHEYWFIYFYTGTRSSYIGLKLFNSGTYGFDKSVVTPQTCIIPIKDFAPKTSTFNRVVIFATQPNGIWQVDNVRLGQGSAIVPYLTPPEYTLSPIVADAFSLKRNGIVVSTINLAISAWNTAYNWVTTNGANVLAHITNKQNSLATDGTGAKYPTVDAVNTGLATKLDASAYSQHFKGVYLSLAALNAAHPTAEAGDYAQVNEVGATDVLNYNWDAEENIWIPNAVAGSGANNTDQLPEGTVNLYFNTARVLATVLTGISFLTGTAVVATDTVLVAFGKLQKQINDLTTAVGLNTAKVTNATHTGEVAGSGALTIASGVVDRDNLHVSLKTRITNATVTGTYTLDHALGNDWKLTLTGITTIAESNLPTGTDTIEFTMKVTGNFGLTVPAYWTVLGDAYDGTKWNFFTVQIHKGDATQEATCFISNF